VSFGSGKFVGTASSTLGTLQTSGYPPSTIFNAGVLAGGAAGGGAVTDTWTYTLAPIIPAPAASTGDYQIIVVVAASSVSPLNIRVPLVAVESVATGNAAIRAPLVTVESLDEGYRNLRVTGFFIESLHPVDPEGTISTALFPGSLGSPTAMPGLAYSWHKRPRFATQFQQAASGVSVRNALMQYPIWEFEATFEFLRSDVNAEYQALLGFYLSRQGGFDTFLFKDADDYLVTGGTLGTADGVTTQFDFKRTIGGFAEKVGQVDNGATINVYDNGVLKTAGVHYNVVLPNHVVFVTAPVAGHVITADFQFFFNCRFQEDTADFQKFADNFWELQTIRLRRCRSEARHAPAGLHARRLQCAAGHKQFVIANCFTITANQGAVVRLTDAQEDVSIVGWNDVNRYTYSARQA
jgi:uncharacterized protein (TIGR02217 family)